MIEFCKSIKNVNSLWVLKKNRRANFYKRRGFDITDDKKYEEDTMKFLVCMEKKSLVCSTNNLIKANTGTVNRKMIYCFFFAQMQKERKRKKKNIEKT